MTGGSFAALLAYKPDPEDYSPEFDVPDIAAAAREAREWLFDAALPFWSTRGVDHKYGGFHDLLVPEEPGSVRPKRSFVQARQMYVFAEAGSLGWNGKWRDLVGLGATVLRERCRAPNGGFIHRLRADLETDEVRRDLYDQAFIAFASATAGDVLGSSTLVAQARDVLRELDTNWRRGPVGFWEGELPTYQPRRQNPHMHLVEAAWALAKTGNATGEDRERLARMTDFIDTVVDRRRRILVEVFDEDWQPLPDDQTWVEPGHHFEWFWLLERVKAAGGPDRTDVGLDLWSFGLKYGIDPDRNVAIDEVRPDGEIRSAMARLWPQTERLKAGIAAFRLGQAGPEEIVAAYRGLQPYLVTGVEGCFHDKMRPDGSFVGEPVRASSLYHITCAYGELIRLSEEIGR